LGYKLGVVVSDFIRKANQQIALTLEQTVEMARLYKRPTGVFRFLHYCLVNTETGEQNFAKVFKPYQRDMLSLFQNHDRAILLASRQMSKCVSGETIISVKNDKTGEIMDLTIEEFHELQKNTNQN